MGNGATAIVRNSVRVFSRLKTQLTQYPRKVNRRQPYLPHNGTLKHDKHEEREETVVPILVQTPKGDAEDLEDKKRCCCVFREQFGEGGDGNIKLVLSILCYKFSSALLREPFGHQEGGDGGFVGTWVSQRTERDWV